MQDSISTNTSLKDFATSLEIFDVCEEIGKINNLHIDQVGELDSEIRGILLGINQSDDFIDHVVKRLEIDRKLAEKITEEVNEKVFEVLKAKLRSKEIIESTLRNTPNKINPVNSFTPREPVSHTDLEKAGDFTIETENSFKQQASSYKPYSPGYSENLATNTTPVPSIENLNAVSIDQKPQIQESVQQETPRTYPTKPPTVPEQPIVKAEIKTVAEPIVEPKLNIVEPEPYKPSVAELNLNITEPQPNLATAKETVIPPSLESNDQKEPEQKVETPQVVQKKEWPKIIERPTIEKNIPAKIPPPSNMAVPSEQKQPETEVAQMQKQPATEIPQTQNQPITETSKSNVQTPPETPKAQVNPVQIKTRPYSIDPYREPVE